MNKNILIIFLLFSQICFSQGYRITNNNIYDSDPKLIKNIDGKIWCFWNEDYTIVAKFFEDNKWSDKITIQNHKIYNYDIDKSENGNIWVVAKKSLDSLFLYKGNESGFSLISTFYNYNADGSYFGANITVVDSNNIWINAIDSWYQHLFINFKDSVFSVYEVGPGYNVCNRYYTPFKQFLFDKSTIFVLSDGNFQCAGGGGSGPYYELISLTVDDSIFIRNYIATLEYNYEVDYPTVTLGNVSESLIYLFYHFNDELRLDVINPTSESIINTIQNLNFFPEAASIGSEYCALAWFNNDTISFKSVSDTIFYETKTLEPAFLFGDTNRSNLNVTVDDSEYIWLSWQGEIDGQSEIFVAKEKISNNIDTNVVTSIGTNNNIIDKNPDFILRQNYPNPFNPSTKITYSIPSLPLGNDVELVTLKVYDILGQRIATLVNKKQSPGNYEAIFDASSLPSGIYIYKLKMGNFMSAKKMLFLK